MSFTLVPKMGSLADGFTVLRNLGGIDSIAFAVPPAG
eukprot:CAMPEP_0174855660 /NCGR_PEP_ID=MMETSP1114-20130205/33869_1 /TAXON_ID=312471 /ORGANISM="Neobodo designis, Strain CCAP 1951/1" /LENGTH=36 /DNA_ID= /DNA_START= /DNA_END= /DNA_ORIENTATION=